MAKKKVDMVKFKA